MVRIDDRRFNRLALTGLLAGLFLLLTAFGAAVTSISANQQSNRLVRHGYQVVDQLSLLEIQLERAETGRRGYLLARHPYRLSVYRQNAAIAPRTLNRLERLVQSNSEQVRMMERLRPLVADHLRALARSIALIDRGRADLVRAEFEASNRASEIRRTREITARMRQIENRILNQRIARLDETLSVTRWVLTVTGLLLFLVGLGAVLLVRRYTSDLTTARDRLHLLNTDLEGAVAERTTDLQRANDEIQRFAYIVSHDLRSPLVNIMGFTSELDATDTTLGRFLERVERDAPQLVTDEIREAREELPEAISFIRASTQKMDRLINAILKLSREGRRTLTPQHLRMQRMVEEIGKTLEQRMAEAGATLAVEQPLPDLVGDRVAIEQIFSNLIENAVKYGRPGQPVEVRVRGRREMGQVIYEVADNGRGIDPADHERIFDLFRRAGAQDRPGEGIGLAQVRALVHRLGGLIDVESSLGVGSTFRLRLPETFSDQGVNP